MDTNNNHTERIERFLRGKMSEQEENAFKQELRNDAHLRNEAEVMARAIREMKQRQTQAGKDIINDVQDHVVAAASVAEPEPRHKWLQWTSIAALFIVALGIGQHFYGTSRTNALFNQYYEQPQFTATRGGMAQPGGQTVESELSALFSRVSTTPKGNDLLLVIFELEQAQKQAGHDYGYYDYKYDIDWYLALAYVKSDKLGTAREHLLNIIREGAPDNYYAKQEAELYKQIKNLYFL